MAFERERLLAAAGEPAHKLGAGGAVRLPVAAGGS
jgi:hypothetical protein